MSIAIRKYLRVLLVIVLALLIVRRFTVMSPARMAILGVGAVVLAVVIYVMATALRKSRKERDEVPKHPLGLE